MEASSVSSARILVYTSEMSTSRRSSGATQMPDARRWCTYSRRWRPSLREFYQKRQAGSRPRAREGFGVGAHLLSIFFEIFWKPS